MEQPGQPAGAGGSADLPWPALEPAPSNISCSHVSVAGHRFALVEGPFPEVSGEPANGLVQVVPAGFVVRTGATDADLTVWLRVLAEEPGEVALASWDEVVDVSYGAVAGDGLLTGPHAPVTSRSPALTPPRPGPVRARVSARGRDEADRRAELYEILLWPAPEAPEVMHKATDRLGHQLRGQPAPPAVIRPEAAYRWVNDSPIGEGATVTVVTGLGLDQVLEAFGADPGAPVPFDELAEQPDFDPWVAVLPVEGAVLAVEYGGWQGTQEPVLRRASAGGRAASMEWNLSGKTYLSFARAATVLDAFLPPPYHRPDDADVRAALDGLALHYNDPVATGLAAVERFIGYGARREDLARIEAAGVGYRILPWLPDLSSLVFWPPGSRRLYRTPLGPDTEVLAGRPDADLRELAWWAAAEAIAHVGLDTRSEVIDSLARKALTPEAEMHARTSLLSGGLHRDAWMALRNATNPKALAAAINTLDSARCALGPAAADFLELVRAKRWVSGG